MSSHLTIPLILAQFSTQEPSSAYVTPKRPSVNVLQDFLCHQLNVVSLLQRFTSPMKAPLLIVAPLSSVHNNDRMTQNFAAHTDVYLLQQN